ncbi:hypothetical protein B0H11DRAFT_2268923 [Mycena galericulata]|nr:hypothetical protein B0H11DRAFT_2283081 [Mycena galericulata]KAJ7512016.1 hypothetical protein B0H11DRAFT_2268923 [Mycena galericulata]
MFAFKTLLSASLSVLLISSLVSAVPAVPRSAVAHMLSLRQTIPSISNDIPSQCTTACAPFETSLAGVTATNPICTNAIASQLETCLLCVAPVAGDSKASVQDDMDSFTSACAGAGSPINTIKVPSGAGRVVLNTGPVVFTLLILGVVSNVVGC